MSYLDGFPTTNNIDVELNDVVIQAPIIGDGGYLHNYTEISSDSELQLNRNYSVSGLTRINLILPDAPNGSRIGIFAESPAGVAVLPGNTRIQHNDRITSLNIGKIETMDTGTHLMLEKAGLNWIAIVYSGYILVR